MHRRRERAQRLAPVLAHGLMLGVLAALMAMSFGGLVFSGGLAAHAGVGIGLGLFGCLAALVIVALRSTPPGAVGSVHDAPAAVLAVTAASLASRIGADDPRLVGTVIAAVAITSALTGLVLWLLGAFRAGQLVRFLPYPVIGGFMAGTGWVIVSGGVELLAGGGVALSSPSTWPVLADGTVLAQVLPGIALGVVLVAGTRRGARAAFVPLVCVLALAAFYAVVAAWPGLGSVAGSRWVLGASPGEALWPPDLSLLAGVDAGAIGTQAFNIGTAVVISAVALLLSVSGIELATGDDIDLDRELRVAGHANVVAGVGGGLPGFHGLALTIMARRAGVAPRAAALVAVAVVVVVLLFSGAIVGWMPRFVVGGVLVFVGLTLLCDWLLDGWRHMLRIDYAVVVVIVAMIAAVGFLEGVAVGIAVTVALFILAYSRADMIRAERRGDAYPTRVDRPPHEMEALADRAPSIRILELQGFLFFGTANRLLERLRAHLQEDDAAARYLVVDFGRVTGMDSSTVLSLRKAAVLASRHDAELVLTGLGGAMAKQVSSSGLAHHRHVRVADDLDHGVQWCEERLLAGDASPAVSVPGLRERLAADIGSDEMAGRLLGYLVREEVPAGHVILVQGERSRDLLFVESGVVTISIAGAPGQQRRIRTMMAGTVIGEVAMYLQGRRSASAVADTHCVVSRLPEAAIRRLQEHDPEVAAALHRVLARHLASRLADTLRIVEALDR